MQRWINFFRNLIPGYVFLSALAVFGFMGKGSLFLVMIGSWQVLLVLAAAGFFVSFVLQNVYRGGAYVREELPRMEAAEACMLKSAIGEDAYARWVGSKQESRYASLVIESALARESNGDIRSRRCALAGRANAAGAANIALMAASVFGLFMCIWWTPDAAGILPAAFLAVTLVLACVPLEASRKNLLDAHRVMTSVFVNTHRGELIEFLEGDASASDVRSRAKAGGAETENGTHSSGKHAALLKKSV